MIGLDSLDTRVFNQCVGHKSPEGDLDEFKFFKLADMELTLDCVMMRSMRPIQFIETLQSFLKCYFINNWNRLACQDSYQLVQQID